MPTELRRCQNLLRWTPLKLSMRSLIDSNRWSRAIKPQKAQSKTKCLSRKQHPSFLQNKISVSQMPNRLWLQLHQFSPCPNHEKWPKHRIKISLTRLNPLSSWAVLNRILSNSSWTRISSNNFRHTSNRPCSTKISSRSKSRATNWCKHKRQRTKMSLNRDNWPSKNWLTTWKRRMASRKSRPRSAWRGKLT